MISRTSFLTSAALFLMAALWLLAGTCLALAQAASPEAGLTIIEPGGKPGRNCPLEHTSVNAEVSGFVARVRVTQIFHNPLNEKIEAVYTFPLSQDAAVDDMLMRVGSREVRGVIKPREEARRIYETARDRGHVASLLDQERPNIFTQSVANIMPGEKVEVTIRYVEIVPYDDGAFTFVFPMVVGPRFIPGRSQGPPFIKGDSRGFSAGTGWAPDTDRVPDASRITPPVTPEGARAGHDIDLTISVDAGVPILGIESKLHEVEIKRDGTKRAVVSLKNSREIPNKDFVLKYLVAGDEVRSGVLTHKDGKDGYIAVILIPPKRAKPEQIAAKEMIFVIDCSGSQAGWPLEKAKEAMRYFIEHMNPNDTFNIIDFNVGARMLFPEPVKNSPETREKALRYMAGLQARGGTWMGPAVETVSAAPTAENRLRIVTFMTDGYVGNDFEIISLVKKLRGKSRWFPFGTGNSVNRFLLDNMARVGGGEVEYILLNTPGEVAAKRFYERIASPILTDISLSFSGISLEEVYPAEVSDLWSRKPLVFKARYSKAGKGTVTIKGLSGGKPYEQSLEVTLPDTAKENQALGSLWARSKVDALMDGDLLGVQRGSLKDDTKEQIVKVALAHRIMTQFTSFVAVEEAVVTVDGKPKKVTVPVEMPDGVSREGVFGKSGDHANGGAGATMSNLTGSYAPGAAGRSAGAVRRSDSSRSRTSLFLDKAPAGAPTAPEPGLRGKRETETSQLGQQAPEEKTVALAKLAPELRALLKLKKTGDYTEGKVTVREGKVTVQVWISQGTEQVIKKLEQAGLKISFRASTGKAVIGLIEVEKLENLANLPEITLVEPLPVG